MTIWRSRSFEAAIELAERDAKEYAEAVEARYIGVAQSCHLAVDDRPLADRDEVFSLMRASELSPDEYITRFFDTSCETQETTGQERAPRRSVARRAGASVGELPAVRSAGVPIKPRALVATAASRQLGRLTVWAPRE